MTVAVLGVSVDTQAHVAKISAIPCLSLKIVSWFRFDKDTTSPLILFRAPNRPWSFRLKDGLDSRAHRFENHQFFPASRGSGQPIRNISLQENVCSVLDIYLLGISVRLFRTF